jgi:hypothetical protein
MELARAITIPFCLTLVVQGIFVMASDGVMNRGGSSIWVFCLRRRRREKGIGGKRKPAKYSQNM